jgi:hypothetical protein
VGSLFGQILTVKSSFEKDSILLGEQINFILSVESQKDAQLVLPVFMDTLTPEIEILHVNEIDTSFLDNRQFLRQEYLITSFSPGWNTIPPLPVAFQTGEVSDTMYSTAALLTVLAPVVDTTQAIKDIKPPLNTPLSLAEVLPLALLGWGGFLLLTLLAALVWIRFQKENNPEQFNVKPLEAAHIIAFRELDKLKEEDLPSKGMIKEYYSQLTEIIRIYIARQYAIHAMESTSSEILEAFTIQNPHENELSDRLEELLLLADLVKFAKEAPSNKENELHLANARDFVEKTYRIFLPDESENVQEEDIVSRELEVESVKMDKENG